MKDKQFNHILSECLDRLVCGESVEQCVQQYPEHADELRSLLQTASVVKKAASIEPRAEFRTQARAQFREALREASEKKSRSSFQWLPNWSVALAGVLIVMLVSAGTMVAAQNSMPDQPLYGVKLATENARVKLATSDIAKAELYAKLADRRVEEIAYLADKGKDGQVERISQKFDNYVALIAVLVSGRDAPQDEMKLMAPAAAPSPDETPPITEEAPMVGATRAEDNKEEVNTRKERLKALVKRLAEEHPRTLREALKRVPEEYKPAIQRAIEQSGMDYQQALDALNAAED